MEQQTIKMRKCEKCGTVFKEGLDRCPQCNSRRVISYEMENPVSRLPMEAMLNMAGHCLWILGVCICIALLWDTNTDNADLNWLYALAGFGALFLGLVFSVAMFGLGEILSRLIRVQRRVRAFTKEYYAQDLSVCVPPEVQAPDKATLEPAPPEQAEPEPAAPEGGASTGEESS